MEIIFDENKNNTFQDEVYPVFDLQTSDLVSFKKIQKSVRQLIRENQQNKTIIIRPDKENDYFLLFVALFDIENRGVRPVRAIFKVNRHKDAFDKYRPYFFFTVAADYVLRLLDMDRAEMYKDIQSLSYLGLEVKRDYIWNMLTLHLSGRKSAENIKTYMFRVSSLENTLILASFVKMLSLLKVDIDMNVLIRIKLIADDDAVAADREDVLRKLFWCAKPFLQGRGFESILNMGV